MRFLVLTLHGPMMSFGGPVIDGTGNTKRLPGLSELTGLIANALGYDRSHYESLTVLRDSLIFAAREDVAGKIMNDFQTAKLAHNDKAWTRFGVEGRTGGNGTYDSPAIMNRPFLADHAVTAVVSVPDDALFEAIRTALKAPARPLFLGRKAFLPSGPILDLLRPETVEAENALAALCAVPHRETGMSPNVWACWPVNDSNTGEAKRVFDLKDHRANKHSGSRKHREGRISVSAA